MKLGFELLIQGDCSDYGWVERQNHENPYSTQELLNAVIDSANESKINKILSIPSPYARFHVTETAFIEAKNRSFRDLAPVYRRAISHCLDMFELFFEYNGVQLRDENVEIKKHHYQTASDIEIDNQNLKTYIGSLDLYRKNYGNDKFNNFYRIVRKVDGVEHLLGSTSPFTIFTTPEDISDECEFYLNSPNRTLFSYSEENGDGKKLWSGIENRTPQFQQFLYSLIKKYNQAYPVMWDYVDRWIQNGIKNQVTADPNFFDNNYPQYIIDGTAGVPIKVDAALPAGMNVEVLPLGYDTFVFMNFVDTGNAHDYSIVEKSCSPLYKDPLLVRQNVFKNSVNPTPLCWLTIHDLLEDDVFVTRNHIDASKYFANTEDNDEEYDAILPFKKKFFELFNMYDEFGKLKETEELKKWVTERFVTIKEGDSINGFVKKRKLYVTLNLPIKDSDRTVMLTKVYEPEHIHELKIDFGIYPFQQVSRSYHDGYGPDNFYRIMLYLTGDRIKKLEEDIKLYAKENTADGIYLLKDEDISQNQQGHYHVQRHSTITEENYQGIIKDNLYYVSLESRYYTGNDMSKYRDVRFDFVEITIEGMKMLLVPRFEQKNLTGSHNNAIAIDLGTSNTYVAYGYGKNTHSFEDDNYNVLVGKLCYKDNNVYDFVQNGLHQCTEFIPTEFGREDNKGGFPIQSVQLFQPSVISDRLLDHDIKAPDGAPFVSMFTMNIPFLFDKKGCRTIGSSIVDTKITNFKWFSTANEEHKEQNAFILFADQLCYMLRNKFISMNWDLNNVKLIWTYPLAIAGSEMINLFDNVWENCYRKYFNDDVRNLCRFTESETPIEKASFANTPNDIKVGIDIGGGTSDVIIYEPNNNNRSGNTINEATLAASFSFAGNVMFGKIIGNDAAMLNKDNVWYNVLSKQVQMEGASSINGDGVTANILDAGPNKHNITDFMDFIFSHVMSRNEAQMRMAMANPALKFISLMHVSSLIWEVAKICRVKLNDKLPTYIALSGNGSKLILMSEKNDANKSNTITKLINLIFATVYGKTNININVETYSEPKKATAEGALNIIEKQKNLEKHVNVATVNYSLYRNKLYLLSEEVLDNMGGTSGNNMLGTDNSFGNASQGEDLFGGMFDSISMPEPQETSTPSDTTNLNYGTCPETDIILKEWKEIAAEIGEYLDFFFKLAGAPLGGKINQGGISMIRRGVLGDDSRYDTENMYTLIERAKKTIDIKAQVMSNGLNADNRIKESIFLAVMAQIVAEVIKFFGKNAK